MGPLEVLIILLMFGVPAYVIYRIARPGSRPCPRCGKRVKNGVLTCDKCGLDFLTIGQPAKQ